MRPNGLRANEGRETKALNCKPITNLKEKSELSNYSKTSGFRFARCYWLWFAVWFTNYIEQYYILPF